MPGGSSCGRCGAPATGRDAFLNLEGATVCRLCYYAEQTALQGARAEESKQRFGFFAAFRLARRLLLGGIVVLVASAGLLGSVREGDWRVAGMMALLAGLGVLFIFIALKTTVEPHD